MTSSFFMAEFLDFLAATRPRIVATPRCERFCANWIDVAR